METNNKKMQRLEKELTVYARSYGKPPLYFIRRTLAGIRTIGEWQTDPEYQRLHEECLEFIVWHEREELQSVEKGIEDEILLADLLIKQGNGYAYDRETVEKYLRFRRKKW